MLSTSKLLKDNGLVPPPHEFSSNTPTPPPPTPNVTISVIMGSPVPCTPALPVGNQCWVTWHIIVWQPNVISVINGDIWMRFAIFGSAEDVMPWGTWSITAQSTHLLNQKLTILMGEPIPTTMTSIPLWITTKGMVCVEPGAQIYEGGNVMISFLSHVFFLSLLDYFSHSSHVFPTFHQVLQPSP